MNVLMDTGVQGNDVFLVMGRCTVGPSELPLTWAEPGLYEVELGDSVVSFSGSQRWRK